MPASPIEADVREKVVEYYVQQLAQASPAKREYIIRMLIRYLPKGLIMGMYITQAVQSEEKEPETESL